ncbi:MAG: hypothetical protein ABEI86_10330 [Halobacteriaceae archaeon]
MNETRYAVYNSELNRLLTAVTGASTFIDIERAMEVKDGFGGGDHLEIVKVSPLGINQ